MLGRRSFVLGASAGVLAGCGGAGNVGSGQAFSNGSPDAILMMRVRTYDHFEIGFRILPFDRTSGKSGSAGFKTDHAFLPECGEGAARDGLLVCRPWYSGYIVDRVAPGDYHIATVFRQVARTSVTGSVDPGKGFPKRYAFRLAPGRVNYLGDFLVTFGGNSFQMNNDQTGIEGARAHLQKRFPRITADVVATFPAPRTGPA